ncbi:MFS transporter [Nocardioides sp. YIM 152315]|uniref:MFS transporter n=1 Tax=Nocardioides sp. YIM 152315 TaxID=3031760 RepID=UPI0023DA3A9B|nr:MFS transporter [Nocardioides sp. YIM 152315]MDF1603333.1 MFS transporter [Nocardioides sp. YIM 152315]
MRDLPRVVWALAAARFVSSMSSFVMLFLTLYLTGPRDLPIAGAGLVAGASGLGYLVGNFTGGRWGDRHGHRRVLLVASTAAGLGLVTVPWLPVWVLVLGLPTLSYLSATAGVSTGALVALAMPRGDRRTAVAIGRAASNAGFVIGPPLGALVVAHSYAALFWIDGTLTVLVAWAVCAGLPRDEPLAVDRSGPGLWRALRADRALVTLLTAVVLVDLVYRQLYTTLPVHLRDEGQPVGLYTALIAVGSGLILLLEVPVAMALRRCSSYPIIAVGYTLVGIGTAMFGLPVTAVGAVLAMVVLTAGEILYKTTATAHVLDAAPDHLVGQYQGLYAGASTSGTLLAGPVGGVVYAVAPGALWPLCGALCVAAAVLVLGSARRQSPVDAAV